MRGHRYEPVQRMKCGCVVSRDKGCEGTIRVSCHAVAGHSRDTKHPAWKWNEAEGRFTNTERE